MLSAVRARALLLSCVLFGLLTVVLCRLRIADALDLVVWKLRYRRGADHLARSTLRLIERRARRRGLARPAHATRAAWIQQLSPTPVATALARLHDEAEFGGGTRLDYKSMTLLCRSAVATISSVAILQVQQQRSPSP